MSLPIDPLGEAWRVRPPPRIPRPAFILPVPVDPAGETGPTAGQARGPHWRRTSPGLWVPTAATVDQPAQRIVEAAGHLPAGGAVTGWASLHLAGARYFEGRTAAGADLPVPLAMGRDRHRVAPGAHVDRRRLDEAEIEVRCGVPCTRVHRAITDEALRRGDLWEAVCVIDMVCYAELTSLARLREHVVTATRGRERCFLLAAVERASEGAESPQEVALRRVWVERTDLTTPLANVDVYDDCGRFLGRPDLLDPELGIVGDYDGAHHRETAARRRDVVREAGFRDCGLEYVSVVAGELHDEDAIAERIERAAARARRSALPRTWTVTRPPRAVHLTLDERIDLRRRHHLPLAGPGFAVAECR